MLILTSGIDRKLETWTSGYYGRVLRPLMFIPILASALLLAGCGGGASKEDFAQEVVTARNDADAGLAQIVQASSLEDLLARMKIAAVELRGAATDVRTADAPGELEDERDLLAKRLLALSDEIILTVETFESFPQAQAAQALNFEQWDAVQASLASLRREGIKVPALERHKPELQRQ
jgi:outer membrane PBP1 activator LpoA protein